MVRVIRRKSGVCCPIPHACTLPTLILPSFSNGHEDLICWGSMTSGQCTIKWLMTICLKSNWRVTHVLWKMTIWKWPSSQRICTFLWTAASCGLLTNETQRYRYMTINGSCTRYPNIDKMILHALRDCPLAHDVWCGLADAK